MLAKKAFLDLQKLVTSAHKKFENLQCVRVKLVNTVTCKIEFSTAYHVRAVIEDPSKAKKVHDEANVIELVETVQD